MNFTYEKLYIALFAILLSLFNRNNKHFALLFFGYLINFILYPAASYLLPLFAFILIKILLKFHKNPVLFALFSASYLVLVLSNIFYWEKISKISQFYYDYVGKSNNNEFRFLLLRITLTNVKENVWFGTVYRSEPTSINIDGANIVSHNDYLNMVLGGGLFVLILFIAISFFILFKSVYFIVEQTKDSESGKFMFALSTTFLTMLLLSNFSALLSKPNNSIVFYTFGATILTLCHTSRRINLSS